MMTTTTRARRLIAVLAIGVVVLTGACGGDDGADNAGTATTVKGASSAGGDKAVATSSITVKDFRFDPKTATVKVGQEVTWTNEDSANHGITDKGKAFTGPAFGPEADSKTFSHTYDKPGTYPYFCNIHESMTGTINVT